MRANRSGLQKRIDRLAKQVVPSEEEYRQRLKTMSDIELEWRIVQCYEEVLGPLAAFENFEQMESKTAGLPADMVQSWLTDLRSGLTGHMKRRWWFALHLPHGVPKVLQRSVDRGPFFGHYLFLECSQCALEDPGFFYKGARVVTYSDLVPAWAVAVIEAAATT